jgi:hypothetical protein
VLAVVQRPEQVGRQFDGTRGQMLNIASSAVNVLSMSDNALLYAFICAM